MLKNIDPIFGIAVLVVSVIAHEVSHGYVADILGDPTARLSGRLTLNPLKHIDPFGSIIVPLITSIAGFPFGWAKPVPFNAYNLKGGDKAIAAVAFAGPLMNLFIAFVFGFLLKFNLIDGLINPEILPLIIYIIFINIVLAFFNLTPITPFDGSKVFFSMLPYKYKRVEEFVERNQLLLLFIFIFFIWSPVIDIILKFTLGFISS